MMVVKGVQSSTNARVEKPNKVKLFVINFLKVVIAVDVIIETGNEFLQPKMPSGISFLVSDDLGGQVTPKGLIGILVVMIRSQVLENRYMCIFQLPIP